MDALTAHSYDHLPTARSCAAKLSQLVGVPFSQLGEHMPANRSSKGYAGHLIESFLGLPRDSRHLDLADGEVKTFLADASGRPKETIAVTVLGAAVDDYIGDDAPVAFAGSRVGTKLANVVYVGIVKPDKKNPDTWSIVSVSIAGHAATPELLSLVAEDYEDICTKLRGNVLAGGRIKTMTGKNGLLQVRSKDSKRLRADGTRAYAPLFSKAFRREVANKNHAFYLKKPFIHAVSDLRGGR